MFFLTVSCASTTKITTTDDEAKIYINGEYLGTGDAVYTDSKIVGSSNVVTLKKEGCRDNTYTFSRSEKFATGAFIGGIFLWPFLLWIMKYKPLRNYEFECD